MCLAEMIPTIRAFRHVGIGIMRPWGDERMETVSRRRQFDLITYFRRPEMLEEIAILIGGLLMGRVCLFADIAPFGIAYLAASVITDRHPNHALIGVVFGIVLLQKEQQYHTACACTLFYVMQLLWTHWNPKSATLDRIFLLFLAQAVLLPIFHAHSIETLLRALITIGISIIAAFILQNTLRTVATIRERHVLSDIEQVCISLSFGMLLLAVTDVQAFGFSLPVVMLLLFSMIAALARGIAGVSIAVALAAALTIGGDFTLMFVGSLAACTLCGALLRKGNTIGTFGGFLAASIATGSYMYTAAHTINLLNLAVSGALFLLIPHQTRMMLCAYLDPEKDNEYFSEKAMLRLRNHVSSELKQAISLCREIAGLFETKIENGTIADTQTQWVAQAAASVCMECNLKKICWKDPKKAAKTVMVMIAAHGQGERIRIRQPFDPSCRRMQQMAAAAWQAQNQYLVQTALRKHTEGQYRFVNRQLNGICDAMEKLSKRAQEDLWLDEDLEIQVLRSLERQGFRSAGVEAAFPNGKLQLTVRLPFSYYDETLAVVTAISNALHQKVTLLTKEKEKRNAVFVFEEAQQLTAQMGVATAAVNENGVNGDTTGQRILPQGRVLYAISDGMGTGEIAGQISAAAIKFLFDLYQCGFSRDVALECLNHLLLKGTREAYATLDAVHLNLHTGHAEFIKYGAPPTFVYRSERLHTVCAEALPIGIVDDAQPAVQRARIRKNDIIIMFSDGVLDSLGERTYETIYRAFEKETDCDALAKNLLEAAIASKTEDDMTVMVIKIA